MRARPSWNSAWIIWTIPKAASKSFAKFLKQHPRLHHSGHLPPPSEPRKIQRQRRGAGSHSGPCGARRSAGRRSRDRERGSRRREAERLSRPRPDHHLVSQFRNHAASGRAAEAHDAHSGGCLQDRHHRAQAFRQCPRAGAGQSLSTHAAGGSGHGRTGLSHARALAGVRRPVHLCRAAGYAGHGRRTGERAAAAASLSRRKDHQSSQSLRRDRRPRPPLDFARRAQSRLPGAAHRRRLSAVSGLARCSSGISSCWPTKCRSPASA